MGGSKMTPWEGGAHLGSPSLREREGCQSGGANHAKVWDMWGRGVVVVCSTLWKDNSIILMCKLFGVNVLVGKLVCEMLLG